MQTIWSDLYETDYKPEARDEEIAQLRQERDLYRDAYHGNMRVLTSWMSAYHKVVAQLHRQDDHE